MERSADFTGFSWEFSGANFTKKQSVKIADLREFPAQILLQNDKGDTSLRRTDRAGPEDVSLRER